MWRVTPGAWFGWPDFAEGRPLTRDEFKPPGKPSPGALLARHPGAPPKPVAVFGVHSSSNGLDFSRSPRFGHVGNAFVAQFGDQAPTTGKVMHPVGFRVVRVDVSSGRIDDFAVNRGPRNEPASKLGSGGLERPVAVRFSPDAQSLYVVDFGVLLETGTHTVPQPGTGVLWRIMREGDR